jgi:hypothetical protein
MSRLAAPLTALHLAALTSLHLAALTSPEHPSALHGSSTFAAYAVGDSTHAPCIRTVLDRCASNPPHPRRMWIAAMPSTPRTLPA